MIENIESLQITLQKNGGNVKKKQSVESAFTST